MTARTNCTVDLGAEIVLLRDNRSVKRLTDSFSRGFVVHFDFLSTALTGKAFLLVIDFWMLTLHTTGRARSAPRASFEETLNGTKATTFSGCSPFNRLMSAVHETRRPRSCSTKGFCAICRHRPARIVCTHLPTPSDISRRYSADADIYSGSTRSSASAKRTFLCVAIMKRA